MLPEMLLFQVNLAIIYFRQIHIAFGQRQTAYVIIYHTVQLTTIAFSAGAPFVSYSTGGAP